MIEDQVLFHLPKFGKNIFSLRNFPDRLKWRDEAVPQRSGFGSLKSVSTLTYNAEFPERRAEAFNPDPCLATTRRNTTTKARDKCFIREIQLNNHIRLSKLSPTILRFLIIPLVLAPKRAPKGPFWRLSIDFPAKVADHQNHAQMPGGRRAPPP